MKLNQDDVDRLRDAFREWHAVKPQPIVREWDDGVRVVLDSAEGIASWGGGRRAVGGISKGRLYELRNMSPPWTLKRSSAQNHAVVEAGHDGDHVAGDAFRALYQSSLEEINRRERRIAELEAEVARLTQQLENTP